LLDSLLQERSYKEGLFTLIATYYKVILFNLKMNSETSPVELLQSVTQLLEDLSVKPYQMASFLKLVDMMSQMKIVGKSLEENHLAQLNAIMEKLTKLCKDSDADLEVRLHILELIEFRALGWRSTKSMEQFYIERFNDARKAKGGRLQTNGASESAKVVEPISTEQQQSVTVASTNEQMTRQRITIGTDDLFLESKNRQVVQLARQQLETFFSKSSNVQITNNSANSSTGQNQNEQNRVSNPVRLQVDWRAPSMDGTHPVMYSRETLLELATNPYAQDAPMNWNERIKTLPSVVVKKRELTRN